MVDRLYLCALQGIKTITVNGNDDDHIDNDVNYDNSCYNNSNNYYYNNSNNNSNYTFPVGRLGVYREHLVNSFDPDFPIFALQPPIHVCPTHPMQFR
jgi:hypothetical protein